MERQPASLGNGVGRDVVGKGVVEGKPVVPGRNVMAIGVGVDKVLGMTGVVWRGVPVITANKHEMVVIFFSLLLLGARGY